MRMPLPSFPVVSLVALVVQVAPLFAQQALQVPEGTPDYRPVPGISGRLTSIGSDTMNNLMTLWQEAFKRHYPNTAIQVEGKGSSTAPPALAEGTAHLGPMSRPMKPSEIDAFEKRHGYKPTEVRVALDALAVYVHRDNPIRSLSLAQVDAIFSRTRRGGWPEEIVGWGQLGLPGEWDRPISLYGRNSASGTYGFFKEHALFRGDFKDAVKEQPGSASVVQGVEHDRFGIGYSGIGYRTTGVKALPLSIKQDAPAIEPDMVHVLDGTYPLGRYLYVYFNNPPGKPLDPLIREFLILVLSKAGQEAVIKDGYLPLPPSVIAEEWKKIEQSP